MTLVNVPGSGGEGTNHELIQSALVASPRSRRQSVHAGFSRVPA